MNGRAFDENSVSFDEHGDGRGGQPAARRGSGSCVHAGTTSHRLADAARPDGAASTRASASPPSHSRCPAAFRILEAWSRLIRHRPGVAARRAAQPHGACQPDGACAPARDPGPRPGLHDSQYLRGRPAADGRVSSDQWAGRPHDHHQRGRGRTVHPGADHSRKICSASFPTAWTRSRIRQSRRSRDGLRRALGLGEEFVWLAVGRFEIAEGLPEHAAGVRERSASDIPRPSSCWWAADRSRRETESLARELELGEAVRFLGVRDDVPALVERRGRLRDVLRVGRHADGAAGGRGRRTARRHDQGRRQSRSRAGRGERIPGPAQDTRRWRRRCCG